MKIPLFLTWVFLMVVAILFGKDVALVSGSCQGDQQSLLLQLKNSLTFEEAVSSKLVTWDSSTDCCSWEGVTCDTAGRGHVISLDLSWESITGGIENSTGLFGLRFLQSLNLSFNNFITTLPTGLGNLTNLKHLNLSTAGFTGQIPAEISHMEKLVTLDLSTPYSSLSSSLKLEKPDLTTLVQNLTQLTELRLDGVRISASGNEWCPALSSSLKNLQVLSLSNCLLSGPMDDSLGQIQSLSVINLGGNNLSTPVPQFFANFSNLTVLRLSFCQLQGNFPGEIFQLPLLKIVDLSNNPLLQGSFPEFSQNLSLQTLMLSATNFSGTIPQSIAYLTQIVYLDLSLNRFTGAIPPFRMCKNLTHIDFSHNQLTGEISLTRWEDLVKLVYLDLSHNSLNGSIPPSLFSIPFLQRVQLSFNQLGGLIPDISNVFSSLDTLDLSSNKLEGTIPTFIFDLGRLSVLLLSSNRFNGTIQLELVQKLGNLTKLDLSYNNLTVNASISNFTRSSFPQMTTLKLASCNLRMFPDLSNQSRLSILDLSDNKITGWIPHWIREVGKGPLTYLNLSRNFLVGLPEPFSLPSVFILDLHRNQLQGNIPTPPPFASYVDYSRNNFTSSIPSDIGNNLSFTLFFSLSNNGLTGVIPESICNASIIQVLDLSNNNLSGKLPPCLIERSESLGVLNLRGNQFDGNIPNNFSGACQLKTLDLSGNQLEGKVPESLANCSKLEVLDLGNNQINDEFPCLLKPVTSLRVLVVRNNSFHGSIGCPQTNGTWPRLQIVDLALNNFTGSLPGKCLGTWEAMIADGNETHDHLTFQPFKLSSGLYYQDSITVTLKGLELELVKILTVFTSIDFSCNKLEGKIPAIIGQMNALYVLNFSHNALSGQIPSFLGNLSQLESLDLSHNDLTGEIPRQLTALTFLSVLNLSYNRLFGKIPEGSQFQTFSNDSFQGNEGLCGSPLTKSCPENNAPPTDTVAAEYHDQSSKLNWEFIIPGLAFGLGAGLAVAPVLFCKEVEKLYDDRIERILLVLLPMLGLTYYTRNDWRRIEPEDSFIYNESDAGDEEAEEEESEDGFGGRYCVFCTKLDITRKQAIHDPKCTCFLSPPITPSTSSFSSSSS
ncbi:hypothetical protein Tsubulata_033907 [Turnera subulata]|uniref:Leucine-rich repeat-containing N-terminal plant-type domain-containing protein n=1 Tax=Turnera subulata TaxID=218843 RepID=A0A9Q0GAZ3_9ROSI|nr:hypothetical protein Tsubulata_033907 [Turnera subulata]